MNADDLQNTSNAMEEEVETVQAKMYLYSTKEANSHLGERLGLEEEALENFKYALYEVECDIKVNKETGEAELLKVNGKALKEENQ